MFINLNTTKTSYLFIYLFIYQTRSSATYTMTSGQIYIVHDCSKFKQNLNKIEGHDMQN